MMIACPKTSRLDHFLAGQPYLVQAFGERQGTSQGVLALRYAAQAILDDDHRAVDDEPEIDGPQAHQVAADAGLHHARGSHQHGQWNGEGGDQRCPDVAQQEEQDDDDEEAPSARFFSTVVMVALTSFERFRMVFASVCPAAGVLRISCILASTAAATVRLLAPMSMRAVPTTHFLRRFRSRCRCAAPGQRPTAGHVADVDRGAVARPDDDARRSPPRW